MLLADAQQNGAGLRYLVQHSAGSGKSNSLTWLAHQLVELTAPQTEQPIFDTVLVVTDRRVLDKQIRGCWVGDQQSYYSTTEKSDMLPERPEPPGYFFNHFSTGLHYTSRKFFIMFLEAFSDLAETRLQLLRR